MGSEGGNQSNLFIGNSSLPQFPEPQGKTPNTKVGLAKSSKRMTISLFPLANSRMGFELMGLWKDFSISGWVSFLLPLLSSGGRRQTKMEENRVPSQNGHTREVEEL
jgi:hypothetical protein